MSTGPISSHLDQSLTVSPLKGLQMTARYPTVNSAKPLPGKMRPSEMLKVSMMVIMKYRPVHVPSTSFSNFPVTNSCIFRPKYEGCRVTCRSRLYRKNILGDVANGASLLGRCSLEVRDLVWSNDYFVKESQVVEAKVNCSKSLECSKVHSMAQHFSNALLQPHKYILPDRESRLHPVLMKRLITENFCGHQSRTQ